MSVVKVSFIASDPTIKQYEAMIFSDFLRSLRHGNDWFGLIPSDIYYEKYHHVVEALLNRTGCIISLAVLSDDPDVCFGWSMHERNRLHYMFVKRDYRRKGIGKFLLPQDLQEITHLTKIGRTIWEGHLSSVVFNPFL